MGFYRYRRDRKCYQNTFGYDSQGNGGGGLPSQPNTVNFSVTPRHLQKFRLASGEKIDWQFGFQSGSELVENGLITIDDLVLTNSPNYKLLVLSHSFQSGDSTESETDNNDSAEESSNNDVSTEESSKNTGSGSRLSKLGNIK